VPHPFTFKSADGSPPWRVVLGLPTRHTKDWAAVSTAQLRSFARLQPLWLFANLAGAMMLGALLKGAAPAAWVIGWLVLALAVMAGSLLEHRRERRQLAAETPDVTVYRATANAVMLGVLWAVPPVLLAAFHGQHQDLAFAVVTSGMIAGAGIMLAPVPPAALGFMLAVGGGLSAMMIEIGSPLLAAAALFYTAAMAVGCLANGRAEMRRFAAQLALAERNEVVSLLLREFEESGADWLWQVDASRCLVNVSSRIAKLFAAEVKAIEGRPLLALLAGEDWERGDVADGIRDLADRFRLRESFSDLVVPVSIGAETRWWQLSAAPRLDDDGNLLGFWGVGSDVTEQRRATEKIDRMARFDTLTGLANRAQVNEALAAAIAHAHRTASRAALLLIDLDRFKQVNDTLGHPIGDRLLQEVARRLRALGTPQDVCGRLGGDEFAFVVCDANQNRIDDLAERIIAGLCAPFEIDGHRIHIGGSVGSATSPIDGRAPETLLRNADLALYRAKDDGRGVHRRFEPKLHAAAEERRQIETGLREALEGGQFHMVYQPIVDARTGAVEAFEALLRWTHPELGQVSPDRFIPIAEEAHLIGRIGEWVIRTACHDASRWPHPIRVAINMSPEQLCDTALATTLVSALSQSGLAPQRLELELTEAALIKDSGVATVIDSIRALGVRVALDDFGTGRSALGHVARGRFSTLKIDRSFVHGAAGDAPESVAIIRAVVALAQSLGMTTIAEGAETNAEHARLRELGCEQMQGWLVGAPIPADQAAQLVAGGEERKVA